MVFAGGREGGVPTLILRITFSAVVASSVGKVEARSRPRSTRSFAVEGVRSLAAEDRWTSAAGGCDHSQRVQTGTIINGTMLWEEDGLPSVNRTYGIYVPRTYRPGQRTGLVMVFHGWGDPSNEELKGMGKWPWPYHNYYGYGRAADKSGFITVYPRGLADCRKDAQCFVNVTNGSQPRQLGYESWNGVGTTGSTKRGRQVCDTNVQQENYCYESVKARKGGCNACDWTTGYNDVAFVRALLAKLESSLCIDPDRVFATGCSNGGMFVHELAQNLPDKFAAVAANCAGKPHLNYHRMPDGPPVSLMLVTGIYDQTIRGLNRSLGEDWWDGYKFASREQVLKAYRDHNKCPKNMLKRFYQTMKGVHAPASSDIDILSDERDGIADFDKHTMECYEMYYGCAGNTSIVSCEWEGGHDIMKGEPQFAYNFFAEHPRSQTLGVLMSAAAGLYPFFPTVLVAVALHA